MDPCAKGGATGEVEAEGGKVAVVARRHGISESLLYNWRSAWKAAGSAMRAAEPVDFVPLGVLGQDGERRPMLPPPETDQSQQPQGQLRRSGNDRDRVAERCPCLRRCLGEREGAVAGSARDAEHTVISLAPGTKVFLACRPVDLRNGFDGLAAKAQQVIGADPFSGHLFIFRGKRGDYFKGLYWDGSGMWLIAKRLEKGRFVWPPIIDGAMTLTPAQFSVLIEAMDWRRTIAPSPTPQPMLV